MPPRYLVCVCVMCVCARMSLLEVIQEYSRDFKSMFVGICRCRAVISHLYLLQV